MQMPHVGPSESELASSSSPFLNDRSDARYADANSVRTSLNSYQKIACRSSRSPRRTSRINDRIVEERFVERSNLVRSARSSKRRKSRRAKRVNSEMLHRSLSVTRGSLSRRAASKSGNAISIGEGEGRVSLCQNKNTPLRFSVRPWLPRTESSSTSTPKCTPTTSTSHLRVCGRP